MAYKVMAKKKGTKGNYFSVGKRKTIEKAEDLAGELIDEDRKMGLKYHYKIEKEY